MMMKMIMMIIVIQTLKIKKISKDNIIIPSKIVEREVK